MCVNVKGKENTAKVKSNKQIPMSDKEVTTPDVRFWVRQIPVVQLGRECGFAPGRAGTSQPPRPRIFQFTGASRTLPRQADSKHLFCNPLHIFSRHTKYLKSKPLLLPEVRLGGRGEVKLIKLQEVLE